jgi:4-amino-4-deoxy-L-arabinose transferase-like glycosyltransferase
VSVLFLVRATSNDPGAAALAAPSDPQTTIGRPAWQLILCFTLLRVTLAALLPLTPQEAYYWLWSRDLAWSYFDHPPLASYSIALTTALFGATAFGIKMAAVGWSLGSSVAWARLIVDMGSSRRVLWWSLLALNLVGIYQAYGLVIAPDSPLIFAWTATIWAVWRVAATGNGRWWYAAGFFLGLGLLAKYAAILLASAVALFVVASPRQRRWLKRPEPYVGALIASLVFAPVVIWNAQHEWASFAFQSTHRAAGMGHWHPRFLAQLIGTQLLVVSPYLLGVALLTWWGAMRDWRNLLQNDGDLLLVLSATIPLLLFAAVSLRSLVKPNWLAPAYWSLIILAIRARLAADEVPRALKIGLASSAAVLVAAALLTILPNTLLGEADTWSGWPKAARRIEWLQGELAERGERSFVFSTNYKNSALLAFLLKGHPRTYAQDIYGEGALQFDHLPLEGSLQGAAGILAMDDRRDQATPPSQLLQYFGSVTKVATVEVGHGRKTTRRIDLYLCRDYRGHPREARREG